MQQLGIIGGFLLQDLRRGNHLFYFFLNWKSEYWWSKDPFQYIYKINQCCSIWLNAAVNEKLNFYRVNLNISLMSFFADFVLCFKK